jgi:hypothetical protein
MDRVESDGSIVCMHWYSLIELLDLELQLGYIGIGWILWKGTVAELEEGTDV